MTLPIDDLEPIPDLEHEPVLLAADSELPLRQNVELDVTEEHSGKRVDLFLTLCLDGYSRVFLRKIIVEDQVCVDGRPVKPAFKVFAGQKVTINLLPPPPKDGPIDRKSVV